MVDIWSAQMADHCFVLLWYFPIEAYYEVCPDAFPLFLTGSHINLLRGFKTSHCGAGTASSSCPPWPVISACRSAECRTQLLLLMTSACPGFAKALLEKKYRFKRVVANQCRGCAVVFTFCCEVCERNKKSIDRLHPSSESQQCKLLLCNKRRATRSYFSS